MDGWIEQDWIENDWIEGDDLPLGGVSPIGLPLPGAVVGATAYGNPDAMTVIHHRNPGPYSAEPLFLLRTTAGQRLFGRKMPPTVVVADDIGRFATLMEISPVVINTVPLGNDLVGSIGMTEKPQATVSIENRQQEWSRVLASEPVLAMPAGTLLHYGSGESHLLLQGQVERVVLRPTVMTLQYSEP